MRLMDADELLEQIKRFRYYFGRPPRAEELVYAIKNSPTVDTMPVVRCKDCKNGKSGACGDGIDCDGCWHDGNWYCADGERREEE